MTDAEIIKALECCPAHIKCAECPMKQRLNCMSELNKEALDLINRQKAEIERLQKAGEEAMTTKNMHILADVCLSDDHQTEKGGASDA